jgi:hypothetical protein
MTPPLETPVFNCIVNVAPAVDGVVVARVANLAGIEGRGRTEREALAQVVAAFKAVVAKYHAAGEANASRSGDQGPAGKLSWKPTVRHFLADISF